jgi:hypothetical protein
VITTAKITRFTRDMGLTRTHASDETSTPKALHPIELLRV